MNEGEADFVTSVSLLEHIDRIDDMVESLKRITKVGGSGHHVVDFVDHRLYNGQVGSPFEFLNVDSPKRLVHGSNRLRKDQLCARFEQHGFVVEEVRPCRTDPLTAEEQSRFVEPYRSMDRENLEMTCARIFVRRG
jgi:hypothetical protein